MFMHHKSGYINIPMFNENMRVQLNTVYNSEIEIANAEKIKLLGEETVLLLFLFS